LTHRHWAGGAGQALDLGCGLGELQLQEKTICPYSKAKRVRHVGFEKNKCSAGLFFADAVIED